MAESDDAEVEDHRNTTLEEEVADERHVVNIHVLAIHQRKTAKCSEKRRGRETETK